MRIGPDIVLITTQEPRVSSMQVKFLLTNAGFSPLHLARVVPLPPDAGVLSAPLGASQTGDGAVHA